MLRHQGVIRSDLLNRGTGRIRQHSFNTLLDQHRVQVVSDFTRNFKAQSDPNVPGLACYPTQQQLDFYQGWSTATLVKWMKELGYAITLNVPKSVLCVKLETGTIDFSFSPESAVINQVKFTPETPVQPE